MALVLFCQTGFKFNCPRSDQETTNRFMDCQVDVCTNDAPTFPSVSDQCCTRSRSGYSFVSSVCVDSFYGDNDAAMENNCNLC